MATRLEKQWFIAMLRGGYGRASKKDRAGYFVMPSTQRGQGFLSQKGQ